MTAANALPAPSPCPAHVPITTSSQEADEPLRPERARAAKQLAPSAGQCRQPEEEHEARRASSAATWMYALSIRTGGRGRERLLSSSGSGSARRRDQV
jgi:hypothetical protein